MTPTIRRRVERGTAVTLERLKWPDRPHYRHRGTVLGEDAAGTWLSVAPQPFYRGDEIAFHAEWWAVQLVPNNGGWWAAFFPPGAGRFDLYVDIGTPPVWSGDYVTMIDVDLDVVRFRDGRIEIVDEDELAEHSRLFGYPASVVADAERTGAEIKAAIVQGAPPFDGTAGAWLDLLPLDSRP